MGGYNGHHRLDTVEMYDPEKNQWVLKSSMHDVRSDAGSTSVGDYVRTKSTLFQLAMNNANYNSDLHRWRLQWYRCPE